VAGNTDLMWQVMLCSSEMGFHRVMGSFNCGCKFDKLNPHSKNNYLRQGGNVFARLCLFVCVLAR